ncbi:MAG TPA: pyridoxamine 5'-phosphate oxidase family protein [Candidatus Dormibacteraeota bacterium]|nr:pyridoxamine 5'-phosphate oxidase family protein [Candidatus Dormibacteraeota bacterium]
MHETPSDLAALQDLLDRSAAQAGVHMQRIVTPERRLSAQELSQRLTGMSLLALATVTADGRPIVGPVDGIFYRGAFHFGSAPDSVRFRHIGRRPQVSATHLPGEHLAVTVHGRATPIDIRSPEHSGFRQTLLDIYVPRYGADWETSFLDAGPMYARIDADRMFTFHMDEDAHASGQARED